MPSGRRRSGPDTTKPTPQSAATNGDGTRVVVTFSEALDPASGSDATWTLTNTASVIASIVSVAGTQVTLATDTPILESDVGITIDFAQGSNPLTDLAGNEADNFAELAVTNNVSTSISVILPGTWSGYWDADSLEADPATWDSLDGAVGGAMVGDPVLLTDWLGSGRSALDLNGTSQYVTADAFAALITGNDLPFAVALHVALDDATARTFFSTSRSTVTNEYRRLNQLNSTTLRFQSITTSSDSAWTPTLATEYVITCSYSGTAVTTTVNGVAIHSAAANNIAALTLELFTLGALRRSDLTQLLDGQVRRFAFRTTVFAAGDVTALQAWLST